MQHETGLISQNHHKDTLKQQNRQDQAFKLPDNQHFNNNIQIANLVTSKANVKLSVPSFYWLNLVTAGQPVLERIQSK